MIIISDERCTGYRAYGHPEGPERISRALDRLRRQTDLPLAWAEPLAVEEAVLLRAHTRQHIEAIRAAEQDFDLDTPAYPDIHEHACRSVGGALRALQAARAGEVAFSLLRPPGHHATRSRAMGFCFFGNVALTVLEALHTGTKRVAVFDFDVHHGNGTEAILLNHPGVTFYSVHQYPCFPGTGTSHVGENCFNYPIPPQTPREQHRQVLQRALEELKKSRPELVAVSAGFDAYKDDPIAHEMLELEDFHWMGQQIRNLGVPAFHALEGGYSDDLPDLILAYLKGLNGSQ